MGRNPRLTPETERNGKLLWRPYVPLGVKKISEVKVDEVSKMIVKRTPLNTSVSTCNQSAINLHQYQTSTTCTLTIISSSTLFKVSSASSSSIVSSSKSSCERTGLSKTNKKVILLLEETLTVNVPPAIY